MKEKEIDQLTKKIMVIVEEEMLITPQEVALMLRRSVAYVYKHKERLGVLDLPGVRFSMKRVLEVLQQDRSTPPARTLPKRKYREAVWDGLRK